ncbi:flocculation protein FLO11-like isoform X2 [Acanthopagrus latus]|uniref:flocculation protein FLO11-like isoform X2 n=1 Tax=Acanthopagrus latus TaxID=8177 RepID=UPI00187C1655|nr:flocculation protein FLO11-like isoform X2 [Acanthopagrus latus]
MKVHQMLICIFILSLQDGNTGLINAETITVTEGGNFTHACVFFVSGSRKIFCKEGCEEKDILVETTGDRAQRGRYSIEYKQTGVISSVLYVSITNLTKSDSGRYTCRVDRGILSNKEFEIRVEDALITEPNRPLPPRPPSVPSTSAPTTTQSSNFVPGTLITEPNRPLPPRPPSVLSTSAPTTTQSSNVVPRSSTPSSASTDTSSQSGERTAGVQLYVCLALLFMVVMLSVAVVIFCRGRASKPKGKPVETEYADVTEASQAYEEIREDRERRSSPVEISTVYTCAKYVKPNAEDTKDNSSLVNGATCENKTEADSNKLTYSEVDFSNRTAASLSSAPCGDADNVVYSVPRGARSDGSHGGDASPPLYSTVTVPHV